MAPVDRVNLGVRGGFDRSERAVWLRARSYRMVRCVRSAQGHSQATGGRPLGHAKQPNRQGVERQASRLPISACSRGHQPPESLGVFASGACFVASVDTPHLTEKQSFTGVLGCGRHETLEDRIALKKASVDRVNLGVRPL